MKAIESTVSVPELEEDKKLCELRKCFIAEVETVTAILEELQKDSIVQSFEKRTITDSVDAFAVTLTTGNEVDVYVSFNGNSNSNNCFRLSAKIASLVIGASHWTNAASVSSFLRSTIRIRHFRGQLAAFRRKAHSRLERFIRSKGNDFLLSVEKDPEKSSVIVLKCKVDGTVFAFSFSLGSKQSWVLENRANRVGLPSIYSNMEELEASPSPFLEKVGLLAKRVYKRDVKQKFVHPKRFHLV